MAVEDVLAENVKVTRLASRITDAVLRELNGRAGFDHWWDSIDSEIRAEIDLVLTNAVKGVLSDEES